MNIKTPEQIQFMREGGKILAEILHELAMMTHIGVTTEAIDIKAQALMAQHHVDPSFKGYHGYPTVTCISINEEVVHTIPGKRIINDGDIVTIDCAVIHKGFHTDAAVTVMVGNVTPEAVKFVNATQKALEKGVAAIRPGARVGDIGFAVQQYIEANGYSIVRDYVGHGIGRAMHEEPQVPNFGKKGHGPLLVPGMTIAIEPIVAMGERYVDEQSDGWTVVTRDGALACQIEHTIYIGPNGPEVLTKYAGAINSVYSNRI